MTTFKKQIHKAICKALIKEIKRRKPSEYDSDPSHEIIRKYFIDAEKGIRAGLAFCPNDENLIQILEIEVESCS